MLGTLGAGLVASLIALGAFSGVTEFWWLAGALTTWMSAFGFAHRRRLLALKRPPLVRALRAPTEPPE